MKSFLNAWTAFSPEKIGGNAVFFFVCKKSFDFPLSFFRSQLLYIIERSQCMKVKEGKEELVDGEFFLIRRMKQGDEAAFDQFVRKHYSDILQYCAYHCLDQNHAEDLTQEVFVRFFARLSQYRCKGKTKNYLYTIAGNLCKNHYKKQRETPVPDDILAERGEMDTGHEDSVAERLAMEDALTQLPPHVKVIIELYYFQELKLREIASILKIGLPLVKYRLRQGKKQLRKLLEKEETKK